jgi:hypothetical protein
MQHVVHDINASHAIAYWKNIMTALELNYILKSDLPTKVKKLLKLIETSHVGKEYRRLSKLGEKILSSTDEEDMVNFQKLTWHEITAINNDNTPINGSDIDTIPKKRNILLRTIIGIIKIPLSILTAIFLIPMVIKLKMTLNSQKQGLYKTHEMTADAFEVFYGFASESGEVSKKLSQYYKNSGDMGLINYVPLFNAYKCYNDLFTDYFQMIFGYPPARQRIVNSYVNCEFELKNNKDLSPQAKKELREQMESLKNTYNEYVLKYDSKGGFIYRIASIIGANTIEKAAQKDTSLVESVLKPLKEKRDQGAFK